MRNIKYFLKRYIHLIFFIILILLSLFLLLNSQNLIIKSIKSNSLSFFSSFQLGFSGISSIFSHISDHFDDLNKVKEELILTQKKLHEAYQKINEIEDLKKQNIKLRGIIGYSYTVPSLYDNAVKIVPAMVIAKQPGNYAFSFMVNKGRKDGIRVNMPVIAPYDVDEQGNPSDSTVQGKRYQGLVGKIITVSENTSIVLPLYNNSFFISAKFQGTEYEGLINGLGENNPCVLMQYVEKNMEIKYGDIVVSSGLGQLYPRGIHIGKVKAIKSKPYETSMECEIEPAVVFSRLENVFIIKGL